MLTIGAKLTADTLTREATDDVEEDEAEREEPRAVINSLARVSILPLRLSKVWLDSHENVSILMRMFRFS